MDTGQPMVGVITTRHITLIYIQNYIHFIICGIWAPGRIIGRHQNASYLILEGPY